jgi:hypothetical protein
MMHDLSFMLSFYQVTRETRKMIYDRLIDDESNISHAGDVVRSIFDEECCRKIRYNFLENIFGLKFYKTFH